MAQAPSPNDNVDNDLRNYLNQIDAIAPHQSPNSSLGATCGSSGNRSIDMALAQHFRELELNPIPAPYGQSQLGAARSQMQVKFVPFSMSLSAAEAQSGATAAQASTQQPQKERATCGGVVVPKKNEGLSPGYVPYADWAANPNLVCSTPESNSTAPGATAQPLAADQRKRKTAHGGEVVIPKIREKISPEDVEYSEWLSRANIVASTPIPIRPVPDLTLPDRPRQHSYWHTEGMTAGASRSWQEAEQQGAAGACALATAGAGGPASMPDPALTFNPNIKLDVQRVMEKCNENPEAPGRSSSHNQRLYAIRRIMECNEEIKAMLRLMWSYASPDQQPASYYYALQCMWRFEYISQLYKTSNTQLRPEFFHFTQLAFESLKEATSNPNRTVAAYSRLAHRLMKITRYVTDMVNPHRLSLLPQQSFRQSEFNLQMSQVREEDPELPDIMDKFKK